MNTIELLSFHVWRERGLEPAGWAALADAVEERGGEAPGLRVASGLAACEAECGCPADCRLKCVLFWLACQPLERGAFLAWLLGRLMEGWEGVAEEEGESIAWGEIHEEIKQNGIPRDVRLAARKEADRLGVVGTVGGDFARLLRGDLVPLTAAMTTVSSRLRRRAATA